MSFSTLVKDLEEFKALQVYHAKVKGMLDKIVKDDVSCLLHLGLIDNNRPALPLEIEYRGETIDWEGFPEGLKKFPFLVLPGAKVKEQPKFDMEFDLELSPTILVSFLTYLLAQIDKRMKHLSKKFSSYDKTE